MTRHVSVVLCEPQDDINIGSVVRVAKNFGFSEIKLVRPRVADPERILISAPRSETEVSALVHYDSLEAAVETCHHVYALSARPRTAQWRTMDPTEAAAEVAGLPETSQVAFVFGREDSGLTNAYLDLCDTIVTVPTAPDYSSLNLAQAVLVQLWEIHRLTSETGEAEAESAPLDVQQMERLFTQVDESLRAIEFYKYGDGEHVMRGIRRIFRKASLDAREYAILMGVFKEIREYLIRAGVHTVDGQS